MPHEDLSNLEKPVVDSLCFKGTIYTYTQVTIMFGKWYIKCLNSIICYSMSSRVLSQLASQQQLDCCKFMLYRGTKFWLPKLVRRTDFGSKGGLGDQFWQNFLPQVARLDRFWCDSTINASVPHPLLNLNSYACYHSISF